MSYSIASTSTTVTLDNPSRIDLSETKEIYRIVLPSGNVKIIDKGKTSDQIIIHGIERYRGLHGANFPLAFAFRFSEDQYEKIRDLNAIAGSGDDVTVAGLVDTNFNADYKIRNINVKQEQGKVSVLFYDITLERKQDALG